MVRININDVGRTSLRGRGPSTKNTANRKFNNIDVVR